MRTQQDEVYRAELLCPVGRVFDSIESIQSYVDGLRDTFWWHAQGYWTVLRVEVGRPSRENEVNGSVGWYDRKRDAGRIEMAKVHWDERSVLHELAHVLAAAKHGSTSHDPYFARVYGTLVYCMMGSDAWLALSQSFADHGVEYL